MCVCVCVCVLHAANTSLFPSSFCLLSLPPSFPPLPSPSPPFPPSPLPFPNLFPLTWRTVVTSLEDFRSNIVGCATERGSGIARSKPFLLQHYTTLHYSYFESGVCSVYMWDLDHGFAGVVLIKKSGDTDKIKGCWDSIHVVEVQVCKPPPSFPSLCHSLPSPPLPQASFFFLYRRKPRVAVHITSLLQQLCCGCRYVCFF